MGNIAVDEIGYIKQVETKADTRMVISESKNKRKNTVKSFLTKFKSFIESPGSSFLTPKAKLTFIELSLAFIKAQIPPNFNLDCYIYFKINVSSSAINEVFNQLTLQNFGRGYDGKTVKSTVQTKPIFIKTYHVYVFVT